MMNRPGRLGAGVALAGLLAATQALAETRLVAGNQLVLSDNQSEDVVIDPDPSLSGRIRIGMEGSLSCLSVVAAPAVVIGTAGCGEAAGRLRIDVSPDTPVTVSINSDGDVHVGDLRGMLVATLNGSGDLVGRRAGAAVVAVHADGDATLGTVDGPVTVDMAGSGDVHLSRVGGPLTAKLAGSGDLVARGIDASAATIEAGGSGDVLLGTGQIGALRARMRGPGDLSVAAAVRDADVEAGGSSDVLLASVAGSFTRDATGDASIKLGNAATIQRLVDRKLGRASTTVSITSPSWVTHVLMAGFLALVGFIAWRFVRGRGTGGQALPPSNPAVVALGETLGRLDSRLGQLETYVTTREFDLNRKFREL